MKIGLDIHGVIDQYPHTFRIWSHDWVAKGYEVHIITGQQWEKAKVTVEKNGITYTHHFSIVDYHRKAKDVKMWQDDKKTWWMNSKTWLKSKGLYIESKMIDTHFDDSVEYAKYMPSFCTFVLVPPCNFFIPNGHF